MRSLLLLFAFLICTSPAFAAVDSIHSTQPKTLEIIKITPDGTDVPVGKQIVIQFNRPVVPVGKMERSAAEIPITITPSLSCQWRWINTSALACNLSDNPPPAATGEKSSSVHIANSISTGGNPSDASENNASTGSHLSSDTTGDAASASNNPSSATTGSPESADGNPSSDVIASTAFVRGNPENTQLKESTKYTIDIKPGIKTEDDATLAKDYQHSFITERPALTYSGFRVWKSPSYPVVELLFNQPVDQDSIAQHMYFSIGDKNQRVALKVIPDPIDRGPTPFSVVYKHDGKEARRGWLIESTEELPLDTHVVLKTEPGLKSAFGPQPSVESKDIVQFDTYPEFAFLGIQCINMLSNSVEPVLISPQNPGVNVKCNPQGAISLIFNSPVKRENISRMLTFTPAIKAWEDSSEDDKETNSEPSEDQNIGEEFRVPHKRGKTYEVWLPAGLKAAQDYTVQSNSLSVFQNLQTLVHPKAKKSDPMEVEDIFGRKLKEAIALKFATDHRNPNFVMPYRSAVLEKGVDSEVPFYVNNLKSYGFSYHRLTAQGAEYDLSFNKEVPQVKDIQFAVPFGIREMLKGKTGAVFGFLHTDPATNDGEKYPPSLFAEITPYQIHLKLGHFSSLVWVTDMSTGTPVSDAIVSFYQDSYTSLKTPIKIAAKATTDVNGLAVLPGTNTLDPDLSLTKKYNNEDQRYFLSVQKGEDLALLPIDSDFAIYSYSAGENTAIYPTNKEEYGHMEAWGTTAQGIYRAGDTIQYKIYVRDQDNKGFVAAPAKTYQLQIVDPMGKVVKEVNNLSLSKFGGISGEFATSKEGAVGWYQFKLIGHFDSKLPQQEWLPMRVLVSDFTPSSFKVSNQLNGDLFHAGQQVEVNTRAELHSGGAYTDATARITAMLDSTSFTSQNPIAKNFQFDSYKDQVSSQQIFQKIDKLNDKGELKLDFNTGNPKVLYGKLSVESAVADDRGKYISGRSSANYIGVDRLVGLHNTDWLYNVGKPASLQYLVVDDHGNPAKGTSVDITLEHQVTKAARVKGAGNAYLTEYHSEWELAGNCKGTSETTPLNCTFTPQKAGVYRATANIKDTKGQPHSTSLSTYATGHDFVAWDDQSDTSLTIIPQSTSYKIGDTARFLVKNPYPGAKALISVERYGVIDHFVQTFDTSTPIVEFKIKPDYLPGVYLSVVIVSPRVEKPLGEGQVDLGKPTFRMGYVTVPVEDPYKQISITAKTDKAVYKPREKVIVSIHAEANKKEPIELAVTVLDDSVFDLIAGGKSYFDPYAGFYKLQDLDMRNYSLLTRLVGRQHFEKKGANPGGDGGASLSMRSVFKFVSYWNADLKTDENGNATATFEAPDNLTGWRILTIATTPTDRFGLGQSTFKVNRPTEVRPVMPNQVLEGDIFNAGFSVMNRTDKERTLEVSIKAAGNIDAAKTPSEVKQTVTLAPYKRATVWMPVQSRLGLGPTSSSEESSIGPRPNLQDQTADEIKFTVTAGDSTDQDGMEQTVPVLKQRSLEVAANYGTTTEDKVKEPIQFPKEMLPNVGNVAVVASPSVIGNIEGAFAYMRDYPYLCWEQKLSKGVTAAQYKDLKAYLPGSFKWEDSNTLPQKTLAEAANYQAPNGGMAYFLPQDQYVDPYLSAYTALAFNWLRKDGYAIPEQVESKLQAYLINLLKNDAAPDFYSEGMRSSVRAVALAALAENGKATLTDLERYAPHVKEMSLFGKSYYLQAASKIKGGEKYAADVIKQILAASNETAGKLVFSEALDTNYDRILTSPLRDNCAVLDAFTASGDQPQLKDIPFKLVRAITQDRKNRDHWENTQENLFCMNALVNFARVYEKNKPDMTVTAAMEGEDFGKAEFKEATDSAVTLERPAQTADVGRKASLEIDREGTGRLYYATRLSYALPLGLSQNTNAGMEIHREYSVERSGQWVLLPSPADIKRGELVRVDLYLSLPAARNFVVVDDPVPGGLEPVNKDLATTSQVDATKGDFVAAGGSYWSKYSDWINFGYSRWSFYHQEIRNDSVRFYSDYLPPGNYHLSYAAQAIATGTFSVLPAKAEEMYDPDVYGKTEGGSLKVSEQLAVTTEE